MLKINKRIMSLVESLNNENLITKSYRDATYTILPDGDYADLKIYAPKGQTYNNGDTFYTTHVILKDADIKAKNIIDGQYRDGYFK